jgi:hypothetical protein
MRAFEIYTLSDPRTLRARYVGVTHLGEKVRYAQHLRQAVKGKARLQNWIRSLLRLGEKPIYLALEYGSGDGWRDRERFWIACHRKFCDLVNGTDGGDGTLGHVVTLEARAKIGAANQGRRHSPEARVKMSAASRGRRHSPETRRKIGAANARRVISPETRAKIAAAKCGNKYALGTRPSPETRAKLSAASRGRRPSPETRAKISEAQKARRARERAGRP